MKATLLQVAATWGVQRALVLGYRRIMGAEPPTARDRGVPLGRILSWAAASAAAVAVASVVVDRVALRPRLGAQPGAETHGADQGHIT